MKEMRFYALIAVLAALNGGLILAGILPPIASYSIDQIILSLAGLGTVAYMGRTFAKDGMKKAAIRGTIAGAISIAIILLSAVIGLTTGNPVLGLQVQPSYLPVAFVSLAVPNIILFAVFAISGAFIAKKLQKNAKK